MALVSSKLPGTEDFHHESWCQLNDRDEAMTWLDDVHGESKTWRGLFELIAADWAGEPNPVLRTMMHN